MGTEIMDMKVICVGAGHSKNVHLCSSSHLMACTLFKAQKESQYFDLVKLMHTLSPLLSFCALSLLLTVPHLENEVNNSVYLMGLF